AGLAGRRLPQVADPQGRPGALCAEVEVPVREQEVDPVLLGRYGVVVARCDELDTCEPELYAAGCPLVGPDGAGGPDAGLLGQALGELEDVLGDLRPHDHALHEAAAVSQL